jgi:hypothetical protein
MPDADYRFKHALIQDAAYENLLKSRRQVLHGRVGETLRDKFAGTAAAEPELLAYHFTQAAMTEAAIEWWGKAGQRSLERSALVEAAEQFTRALDQIAILPGTPALRRQGITLQVALITPPGHVKGYAAPETKAAVERARLMIEQAEARGEPPVDPVLLFSILYGFWLANYIAFNGDAPPSTQVVEVRQSEAFARPKWSVRAFSFVKDRVAPPFTGQGSPSCLTESVARLVAHLLLRRSLDFDFCRRPRAGSRFAAAAWRPASVVEYLP